LPGRIGELYALLALPLLVTATSFFELLTAILSGKSPSGNACPAGVMPQRLGNNTRRLSISCSDWPCTENTPTHSSAARKAGKENDMANSVGLPAEIRLSVAVFPVVFQGLRIECIGKISQLFSPSSLYTLFAPFNPSTLRLRSGQAPARGRPGA